MDPGRHPCYWDLTRGNNLWIIAASPYTTGWNVHALRLRWSPLQPLAPRDPRRRRGGSLPDRQDSSVNAMSQDVLLELGDLLERIALDPPKGVVIQSLKKAGFIAGADLKEFQEFDRRGTVNDAIRRGGHLPEAGRTALPDRGGDPWPLPGRRRHRWPAAAWPDSSTRIGLPETQLGIFPGWGGSARLPQLVGAPAAMDMMLTGRTLSASAARGSAWSTRWWRCSTPPSRWRCPAPAARSSSARWPGPPTRLARRLLAPQMVKQVARKAKKDQYPAPYALISTGNAVAASRSRVWTPSGARW